MPKPTVLVQLDGDSQPSTFDSIVAVDSQVDHLLRHSAVTPGQVQSLVHGAIFTRGPKDLHRTAIFVGGSNVSHGERLLEEVQAAFFGPMRVSVMLDANGANTTAAAAVLCAAKHLELSESEVVILAGTGAVGQRVARLLAPRCKAVRLGSRSAERAAEVCQQITERSQAGQLTPFSSSSAADVAAAMENAAAVIGAGAAGVRLVDEQVLNDAPSLKVAIDLNAVPPLGIEGIQVTDSAVDRGQLCCYGAIGVGGVKMKIHKAAIGHLYESNDQVLDADQIFQLATELGLG